MKRGNPNPDANPSHSRNPNLHFGSSPPYKKRRRSTRAFEAGSRVEVRSTDEGFTGAWFEATIVRLGSSRHRRYRVRYSHLIADEESKTNLEESVSALRIRPRPPGMQIPDGMTHKVFSEEDCVEAFHNDGWWPGVVVERPEDLKEGLYKVYFPKSREMFELSQWDIRRHMEWVGGEWVPWEKTNQGGEHVMIGERTRVEVSRDRENYGAVWFAGTVVKAMGRTYYLVKYENLKVDNDDKLLQEIVDMQYLRPCPPASESTKFELQDEVEGFHQDGWFAGVVTEILAESRYMIKYKHQEKKIVLNHTLLRPCLVWSDGLWVPASQGAMDSRLEGEVDGELSPPSKILNNRNLLVEQLQLEDQTKSSSRRARSHAGRRFRRSVSMQTLSKNNGEGTTNPSRGVNLKVKKIAEPTYKDDKCSIAETLKLESRSATGASQPSKNSDKGKLVKLHLKLRDGTLKDCSAKAPLTTDDKCSNAETLKLGSRSATGAAKHLSRISSHDKCCIAETLKLESRSATGAVKHLSRSPSHEKTATVCPLKTESQSSSSRKLCHGQDRSDGVNGTNDFITPEKKSSAILSGGTDQMKKANFQVVVGLQAADFIQTASLGNGKCSHSPTTNTRVRRKKLAVKRQRMTPNAVDEREQAPEERKEHNTEILAEMNIITFMGGKDQKDFVESSDKMMSSDASDSIPLFCNQDKVMESNNPLSINTTEGNLPGNGHTVFSDKQADIMEGIQDLITREPADKVDEMERATVESPTTSLSPPEEDIPFDDNQFSPGKLPSVKAFVEINNGASLDTSHRELLVSKEDAVAHDKQLSPCGSVSERPPVVEVEQSSCDPPFGSSPCNGHTPDSGNLIQSAAPSVIPSSTVNTIRETQNCISEPVENGRERGNQDAPACLGDITAAALDEPASTGSPSSKDMFEGGEATLIDSLPMNISSEMLMLPFTKKSQFWELLESTEAFRMIPQRPHFHPLLKFGNDFREGMAIGLMTTFANLVSEISSLCILDSKQDIVQKLKALDPLEANGFNVQAVRARLEELLELCSASSQSEREKHSLDAKLQELEEEKMKNSQLVSSVETAISDLEESLSRLQHKKASILLEIEKKESEIVNFKAGLQAAEEARISAEQQFRAAIAVPWKR